MTIPNEWNAVGSPMPDPPATVYPPLPGAEPARAPDRPLEVCIVSNGILGPVRNGGISTLYMGLAEVLVEAGHDVTYLYTASDYTESRPVEEWVEHYRERGIRLVPLPEPSQRVISRACLPQTLAPIAIHFAFGVGVRRLGAAFTGAC